ncbi:type I glutamate--ammonia ligase [Serpentinicella sp. ANB-PHB4]|uniref:type I glutamate--ammonia ligase n=1 Tax=Serpentinicella sp. ANB-PHB4 TaxID=3074076 RepID=UPI0028615783|nr:type I glutamate--ammonia ligase [Serpentinicella sp. ANB-PHB4]MDR5659965.1 type I glutamate--ammonia ligase [Serpentinicella sp. ANB-PHB4]
MSDLGSDDVRRLVRDENVRFINLQFTDIFGKLKNVAITANQLEAALNNEIMFDGSSIKGFVRVEESDMYLRPDPSTFQIFPWRTGVHGQAARMICDVYTTEDEPFLGCPRNVLKRAIDELKKYGYDFHVGPEVEFFLFETDDKGEPTMEIHDTAGYFDLAPTDCGEDARRDMCLVLEELGFEIEASHHEAAPGQHEIDFKYGPALPTADSISTFKLVVKTVAKNHGLHATFMPKPFKDAHGNCMHLNMSLFKDGKNAFYCEDDEEGLTKEAYYFIGGLMKYAREFAAVTNASVNSYKRFVPGYEAPTDVVWGLGNRTPLIRIPNKRGTATRVELRNPDPTANHYLALAAVLWAGIDGIKNQIEPPPYYDGCTYDMDATERDEHNIETFPSSLGEALEELEKSEFMKEALGEHVYHLYLNAKKKEWAAFNKEIHDWEIKNYLKYY